MYIFKRNMKKSGSERSAASAVESARFIFCLEYSLSPKWLLISNAKYHALEVDLDYITEHVIMGIALEKWAYKQLKRVNHLLSSLLRPAQFCSRDGGLWKLLIHTNYLQ